MMCRQHFVAPLLLRIIFIIFFFSGATQVNGEEPSTPSNAISKQGKTYVSGGLVLNEFRSVSLPIALSESPSTVIERKFPLTAQTYALAFTYGTYITENFKTEIRYGTGIIDDTLDEVLDININYYFNWC